MVDQEITLKEIRERKKELEDRIRIDLQLHLKDFYQQTFVRVKKIELEMNETTIFNSKKKYDLSKVNITLEDI